MVFQDGGGGVEGPIETSLKDDQGRDEVGRRRVSGVFQLLDTTFDHDLDPLKWEQKVEGSGEGGVNHLPAQAAAEIEVGTTNGDRTIFQTRQYFIYQTGHSWRAYLPFSFDAEDANVRKRIGHFNDQDGHYVELRGSELKVVARSNSTGSVVNTETKQGQWNLDKMDGTGGADNPSRVNLDKTKIQALVIDFVNPGRTRFGFEVNGTIHYVHEVLHNNQDTHPGVGSGNLPVRCEVVALDGLASTATMRLFNASLQAESGQRLETTPRSTPVRMNRREVGSTSLEPVVAIRAGSQHKGEMNRAFAQPVGGEVLASQDVEVEFRWVRPGIGSIPNATWQQAGSNSMIEFDHDGTHASFDPAQTDLVATGLVAGGGADSKKEPVENTSRPGVGQGAPVVARNISGSASAMSIIYARAINQGSATVRAVIDWQERI